MGNDNSLTNEESGEIVIGSFDAPIATEQTVPESEKAISTSNSFGAKFQLYGAGNDYQYIEIITGIVVDCDYNTEIAVRAQKEQIILTELEVKHSDIYEVYTEIQPIIFSGIETEITVRPNNRMWALYEVQQPPIITDVFNPTQDAFTRSQTEFQSINYGSNSSMIVGRTANDISRSFIQFDTSSIDSSFMLLDSYLRLYYRTTAPTNLNIEVLDADKAWGEHSITDLNRPVPTKIISNEFTTNFQKGYIEFKVSDIVRDWVNKGAINNGFILRLPNETVSGQAIFYTRETSYPPELVVNYYDSRVFSTGRNQHVTILDVIQLKHSNIPTEITVNSVHRESSHNTEIRVHVVGVPFKDDWDMEVTVNKKNIIMEITPAFKDTNHHDTEISVRIPREKKYDFEISASRRKVNTEITVVINDEDIREFEISASRRAINTEITASHVRESGHNTEIEVVRSVQYRTKDMEITVNRPAVNTEISARVPRESSANTVIIASKPSVPTEIEVKSRASVPMEIEIVNSSRMDTVIDVSREVVPTEITVMAFGEDNKDTEIYVPYLSDNLTEITVTIYKDYDTEIDIRNVSKFTTEITASRPKVSTEITVPYYADYNHLTEITPRIFMVDNVNTVIVVGKIMGAYGFIL